ncbi:MAG TPA: mechanosensitive ion channel family protein [Acidimicrobiales bacterium]|jgi:small conductance mechanosensitive channel|nr:mechanosensitive ion channel family protein [Acidimicrobiales bacterium]
MLPVLLQVAPSPELVDACGSSPSWACRQIFDSTGNHALAGAIDYVVGAPLRILFILVLAMVVSRLARRAIRRFTNTISGAAAGVGRYHTIRERAPSVLIPTEGSERAASRAQTIGSVLRSLSTAVIYSIAGVTILGELGINLGPLVASAGIAGVAVGFGAQSLVKDFLSGVFMLMEDQYGVGDIIDAGEAKGTVEAVGLRTTRLRDVEGTVWYIPNGQINRVGNKSQEWARALVDVSVAYDTNLRQAEAIIKDVADSMWHDSEWSTRLLEEPEIWGVEHLGANGIDIRLGIKTRPSEQFTVMRELRTRLKERFDDEGIETSSPQRTLWVQANDGAEQPVPSAGESDGHD